MSLARKDGKITRAMMTDRELALMFHDVDTDGSGAISHSELVGWILGKAVSELSEQDMRGRMEGARTGAGEVACSPSGLAVEIMPGNYRSASREATRKSKLVIGELLIPVGEKNSNGFQTMNLIIREGDEPGDFVQRLRSKVNLMKGLA